MTFVAAAGGERRVPAMTKDDFRKTAGFGINRLREIERNAASVSGEENANERQTQSQDLSPGLSPPGFIFL
jgi:hypothetical protein